MVPAVEGEAIGSHGHRLPVGQRSFQQGLAVGQRAATKGLGGSLSPNRLVSPEKLESETVIGSSSAPPPTRFRQPGHCGGGGRAASPHGPHLETPGGLLTALRPRHGLRPGAACACVCACVQMRARADLRFRHTLGACVPWLESTHRAGRSPGPSFSPWPGPHPDAPGAQVGRIQAQRGFSKHPGTKTLSVKAGGGEIESCAPWGALHTHEISPGEPGPGVSPRLSQQNPHSLCGF